MWSRLSLEMVWGEILPRSSQKAAFVSVPHRTQNIVFSTQLKQLVSIKASQRLMIFVETYSLSLLLMSLLCSNTVSAVSLFIGGTGLI